MLWRPIGIFHGNQIPRFGYYSAQTMRIQDVITTESNQLATAIKFLDEMWQSVITGLNACYPPALFSIRSDIRHPKDRHDHGP
ncbi:hypothetical protein D9K19_25875 [Escherichia coli]|nr:hypothetical protein [Escherichia coli]